MRGAAAGVLRRRWWFRRFPGEPAPDGNHVWKSQTDMLDKARAVEDTVMEQSAKQRQTIDEMAR